MNKMPQQLSSTFHNLWSNAVGTAGYEKWKWKLMDRWLSELVRKVPEGALPDEFEGYER